MDSLSLGTLRRAALGGAVFSVVGAAYFYYKIQERFHKSPYFRKSLEAMKEDEEVVNFLGPPIKTTFLNLARRDNFVTEDRAELHIPLRGAKNKAELRTVCTRTPSEGWKVEELELNVRGKKIPVYFTNE